MTNNEQDIVVKAEALLAGITEDGKWEHEMSDYEWQIAGTHTAVGYITELEDATFIAAAPALVRDLVEEVKRLRADLTFIDDAAAAAAWKRKVDDQ